MPIVRRTVVVRPGDLAEVRGDEPPYWASGGLLHDAEGRVVLVRHAAESRWGDAWLTPGGLLEEGETTVEGLRREVHEEVGLEVVDPRLTRIFNETLTDGARVRHGYFAQFVGRAGSGDVRLGRGIREAAWFDELPDDMAYRADYEGDFRALRDARF